MVVAFLPGCGGGRIRFNRVCALFLFVLLSREGSAIEGFAEIGIDESLGHDSANNIESSLTTKLLELRSNIAKVRHETTEAVEFARVMQASFASCEHSMKDSEAATATIRRIVRDEAGRDGYAVATQVELGEVGSERQMDPIEVKKLKVVLENAIRRAEGDAALSATLKREYEEAHAVAEKMVDANSDKGSVTKSFVIAGEFEDAYKNWSGLFRWKNRLYELTWMSLLKRTEFSRWHGKRETCLWKTASLSFSVSNTSVRWLLKRLK